jgi:hypothetical protein
MTDVKITKKITDMSIYGITGDNQWSGDVVQDNGKSIVVHGKYFPTREQAEHYVNKILGEIA